MREQDLKDAYDVNFHGEDLIIIPDFPEDTTFNINKTIRTSERGVGISEDQRNIPMAIPKK